MIKKGQLLLPHERVTKIRDLIRLLSISAGPKERLLASLVGRLSEAEQIEPRYKSLRLGVMSKYKSAWAGIVRERSRKSRVFRNRKMVY